MICKTTHEENNLKKIEEYFNEKEEGKGSIKI